MRRLLLVLVLLFIPALLWGHGDKTETQAIDEVLRALESVRGFYQTAISPDGAHVAWVESRYRAGGLGAAIFVADLNGDGPPRRISASGNGLAHEDQVAWSPDSRRIAFLSDADKAGQQQLYVADIADGKARELTHLTGFLSNPGWSPGGARIAFLLIEGSQRAAGPLEPMTLPSGVIADHIYEQRIHVVDIESAKVRAVSPPDMYVYEYDWAPDRKHFVAVAAHGDGDNNWWIAQLYRIGLDGQVRSLYKPKRQLANPCVSPDGKTVAFIEGLMSDQGVVGGDIFIVPANGGEVRNLTPNLPASATWLAWAGPDRVLFTEITGGNAGVAAVDTAGKLTSLWNGPELISSGFWRTGLSLARDGKQSAVLRSSATKAPEVFTGSVGAWKPLTHVNDAVQPLWGEPHSVHWKSDNLNVQGWLLPPRHFDPNKKYPLVVHVHGGPAAACMAGWPAAPMASLAAVGYFVFCPNPRGSQGQGEAFTEANIQDFGGGDFRDIMSGIDEVLREFPIDAQRLGIGGWSYGGYMSMWAETQTDRFGAAVAGAGISDWLSYYGENDIDRWMIPYFGASVYDNAAVYAKSAPISFVKNVKTPTLILVGDRDGECPAPQSFEWWHALKTLKVPVEFVVYPGEGHQIQQPEHWRDQIIRSVQWYERWLR